MKVMKQILAVCLVLALVLTGYTPKAATAAAKVKLNKKTASVKVGKTVTLKIKNTKKTVKWSVKSGKKYITLKNKKKKSVTVKAKKVGTAKVVAKVGKKKLTCKIKVTKKSGNSSKSNSKSGNNTTSSNKNVTGTAGKNITLPAGATVFTIGTRKLALGISASDVNTILGTLSTDVKRTEKSPQGYTAIAFNPSGAYDGYLIVYLQNNVVVGICGIGKSMSYGDEVSAGDNGNTLPSGWNIHSDYKTSLNSAGAYQKTIGNATVIAYANALGDNSVYCIQAFNNSIKAENMIYATSENTYDTEVLKVIGQETTELINAFRVFYGKKPLYVNSNLAKCAQTYSNTLTGSTITSRSYEVLGPVLLANGIDYLNCGEAAIYGCADAIGFANSMIEESGIYSAIVDTIYNYVGMGVSVSAASQGYNTYLIMDYVDEIE